MTMNSSDLQMLSLLSGWLSFLEAPFKRFVEFAWIHQFQKATAVPESDSEKM